MTGFNLYPRQQRQADDTRFLKNVDIYFEKLTRVCSILLIMK